MDCNNNTFSYLLHTPQGCVVDEPSFLQINDLNQSRSENFWVRGEFRIQLSYVLCEQKKVIVSQGGIHK